MAVDVSVLLVTYNHERFIRSALASIRSQVTTRSIEIVVADDNSTDNTMSIVAEWAASHPDLVVRVLPQQPRLGITLNYYRGFSQCHGRLVAVLEGDDEWIAVDKIEKQADVLDGREHLALVANRVLLYDEAHSDSSVIPLIGLDSFLTELSSREIAEHNWFATFSCCMYRVEMVNRIPVEVFETTSYDWAINIAVTEFGDAGFLPEVMTLYRVHSGGQWSQQDQVHRDQQLQRLIPQYIKMFGNRVGPELTRSLRQVEERLKQSIHRIIEDPNLEPGDGTAINVPRVAETAPRVSVVMTSYNHGQYVLEAANSVLDQTMGEFEFIVVDDGSSDDSLDTLARITDPRLRVYRLAHNQGAAAALNIAIQQARSELIAVINSDDIWEPTKLARQLEVMEAKPHLGAVFTGVRFIGSDGDPLVPEAIPEWNTVFRQPNRSQAQWLRYFLTNGNCLCHPSVLIRRAFYVEYGLYDNGLRQIPDLQRWITLVKHWPIEVLADEELVQLRLLPQELNASSLSRPNIVRGYREHLAINETFFEGCSTDLLLEGFGDILREPLINTVEERACEIALLWLDTPGPMQSLNRAQGMRELRALLGNPKTGRLLRTRYGIDDLSLRSTAPSIRSTQTEYCPTVPLRWMTSTSPIWFSSTMRTISSTISRPTRSRS